MRQSKSVRLLNAQDIKRNLERMAREIVLQNQAFDALGFIGIRTRGLFWPSDWVRSSRSLMAKTLLGEMDISLYRDDLNALLPYGKVDHTKFLSTSTTTKIILFDDVPTRAEPYERRSIISSTLAVLKPFISQS